MVQRFDCEGLHRLQNSFVTEEDLCTQNVIPLFIAVV